MQSLKADSQEANTAKRRKSTTKNSTARQREYSNSTVQHNKTKQRSLCGRAGNQLQQKVNGVIGWVCEMQDNEIKQDKENNKRIIKIIRKEKEEKKKKKSFGGDMRIQAGNTWQLSRNEKGRRKRKTKKKKKN